MAENPPDVTQIPAPRVDFIDKRTGLMSREWYRFFVNIYNLTGGGTSQVSVEDLQLTPSASTADAQLYSLQSQVEGLYLAPTVPEFRFLRYGSFFDTTTQTTAANTPAALTYNTTDIANGIYRGATTSQIYFTHSAIYNLQFSVQLKNANAALQDVDIWLRINGVDVPGSNGKLSIQNKHGGVDGHDIKGWNFFLSVSSGQYVEIVWCPSSADVTIPYVAASAGPPAIPATYSVVLTISQVNLI